MLPACLTLARQPARFTKEVGRLAFGACFNGSGAFALIGLTRALGLVSQLRALRCLSCIFAQFTRSLFRLAIEVHRFEQLRARLAELPAGIERDSLLLASFCLIEQGLCQFRCACFFRSGLDLFELRKRFVGSLLGVSVQLHG